MCKKLLFIFCLLFLLRPLYSTPSFHIDWVKLDDNLNMLEWNLNEAQKTISQLQTQLDEQVKYSANQQLQLEIYENSCQQLEKRLKIWKTTSTILIIVMSSIVIGEIVWQ